MIDVQLDTSHHTAHLETKWIGVPIKNKKQLRHHAKEKCLAQISLISNGNVTIKNIEILLMAITNLNTSDIKEISAFFPYQSILDAMSSDFYGSCVIGLSYFVDCEAFPKTLFQSEEVLKFLIDSVEKSQKDSKVSDAIYKILAVVMDSEEIREYLLENYILRFLSSSKGPGTGKIRLLFEMARMEPVLSFEYNLAISHMIDEIMRSPSISQALLFMEYLINELIPDVPGFDIDVHEIVLDRLSQSTDSLICKSIIEAAPLLEKDPIELIYFFFDKTDSKFQKWAVIEIRNSIETSSSEVIDNIIKFLLIKFKNVPMNVQREIALVLVAMPISSMNADAILGLAKFATDSDIGVLCCEALLKALGGPNSSIVAEAIEDIASDLSDIAASESTEHSIAAESLLEACKI